MIFQTVEKGKEEKEASGEKADGGKAMHLCVAKCRPRGECRQKGVGDRTRRRVWERCPPCGQSR